MRRRHLIIIISVIILTFLIISGFYVYRSFASIPEIFRLNGELQSEGYYMGEFEFKMIGLAYYLDKGKYITAFSKLNQIHKQLKSREGLIKVPQFADKKEELEFYLNLQNPRTGAFMDDSYPIITYFDPTLNMLEHLELLAKDTGQTLRLKYPLRFLNQINTEEKLKVYLDDLSAVGWIGSKLPKTPYIMAAQIIYYSELERNNLYTFSPKWKQALLKWFYENQDSKTGFWGPRLRSSGQLLKSDLGPTFHIVKLFVDDKGNNIHPEFPLRYKDEMFATTLRKLSKPIPDDAGLAEMHDWSLTRGQGIKLLTNFLWNGASTRNKNSAKKLMEDIVRIKFEKFYVQREGGFSLYPGSEHANLDGTGGVLELLNNVGALSRDRQELLWGSLDKNIVDLGVHKVQELKESDFSFIENFQDINSIRLYGYEPTQDNYDSYVVSIVYPKETPILDVLDLLPKVTHWINTTSQNMGNWVSKERIIQELKNVKTQSIPVSIGNIPLKQANEALQRNRELVVIGFDVFQVPKCKITFRVK
jgi:hypothetical protein